MTTELKTVLDSQAIATRIRELGQAIAARYRGEPLVAVCVLKGAFVFFADLVRAIPQELEVDFIRLSSYASSRESSREVKLVKDLELDIAGKNVLVVEDIVDTGRTLRFLVDTLKVRNPRSVTICALIDKKERREVECLVDFVGFQVQEGFLVGYGLDWAERFRNLPDVSEVVS